MQVHWRGVKDTFYHLREKRRWAEMVRNRVVPNGDDWKVRQCAVNFRRWDIRKLSASILVNGQTGRGKRIFEFFTTFRRRSECVSVLDHH